MLVFKKVFFGGERLVLINRMNLSHCCHLLMLLNTSGNVKMHGKIKDCSSLFPFCFDSALNKKNKNPLFGYLYFINSAVENFKASYTSVHL